MFAEKYIFAPSNEGSSPHEDQKFFAVGSAAERTAKALRRFCKFTCPCLFTMRSRPYQRKRLHCHSIIKYDRKRFLLLEWNSEEVLRLFPFYSREFERRVLFRSAEESTTENEFCRRERKGQSVSEIKMERWAKSRQHGGWVKDGPTTKT